MSFVEWLIAWRYIKSKRSEGFISVSAWFSLIGITLGVATLIIVMSVMNGFRTDLITRIIGINGHMKVYPMKTDSDSYKKLNKQLNENSQVISAMPIIEEQVMIINKENGTGIILRGIESKDLKQQKTIVDGIAYGNIDSFTGKKIVMGRKLANILNVKVGDNITIISPKGFNTAIGGLPRFATFNVVALFDVGMYEFDTGMAFIPMEFAKTFLIRKEPDRIDVFVKNPQNINTDIIKIKQQVSNIKYIISWEQTNQSIISALAVERNVMFLILTLIIIVASFNIIAGMIMLVRIKTKDIAILRTVGATRYQIMRIFFIVGSSIGFVGTFIGGVLGLLFCIYIENIRKFLEFILDTQLFPAEVYYLSRMPSEISSFQVTLVIIMALFLSILASLYPSYRASKVYPAKSLKNE